MAMSSNPLPALLGGPAVRPQGPPDWPLPDPAVLEALEAAFRDGSWGKYQGVYVERLERRLAAYHGVDFVATCASGTFAVELALRALKIGPGDEVIQAGYDYSGNFLGIHAVGATPVLVDIAPGNWNLDPAKLEEAVGPATRALIVSHLHGGIVPMHAVMALAAAHGLQVIEDAAQVPGGVVEGRPAGAWGDAGILSFGGSKLLSAGRGGALLTRHADVYQRARLSLNRGNHVCPLSELQAAVLLPQLDGLDIRNRQRSENVKLLTERLRAVPGLCPFSNAGTETTPVFYKLGFQFDGERFGLTRERFCAAARAEGLAVDEGFRALHVNRSPTRYRRSGELCESSRAHTGVVVLHHPILLGTPEDMAAIVQAIEKIRKHAGQLNCL